MFLSEQSKQHQPHTPNISHISHTPHTPASNAPSSSTTTTPPSASPTPTSSTPIPPAKIKLTWKQHDAVKLLERTCLQGEHDSCYFVGSHYLYPATTNRDPKRSISLLEKSCAGNHAPSCFNLAVLYKKGDVGVPPSEELFMQYKERTSDLVKIYGGLGGQKTA